VKIGKPLLAIIVGFLLFPSDISHATECLAPQPLKPIHHVCGLVSDPSGEHVVDAKVTILKDGKEVAAMQSGADGRFAFEELKAGKYDMRVDAKGFVTAVSSIVLVKPGAACKKELGVLLGVGMSCSVITLGKRKKTQ
jgi:carboxypeptidase family protein